MQSGNSSRRGFVRGGIPGLFVLNGAAGAAGQPPEVRYSELRPHEFRQRLTAQPIAYLPLGTLEWHGEHLPLGSDAIQAEGLMIECARRFGGIVMPPIHLGPDRARPAGDGGMLYGMDYAPSTQPPRQLAGSCYWVPLGLHVVIVDAVLEQLKRAGFRAVFGDGHGPSRKSWTDNLEERQNRFGLKLFGVTSALKGQWKSQVDHAGRNETSMMMFLRPERVDLAQLPADRSVRPVGVAGEDPRDATAQYGRECQEATLDLLRQMFAEAGLLKA